MRACLKEMKEHDEKLRADLAIFGLSYDESVDLSKLENVRNFLLYNSKLAINCCRNCLHWKLSGIWRHNGAQLGTATNRASFGRLKRQKWKKRPKNCSVN